MTYDEGMCNYETSRNEICGEPTEFTYNFHYSARKSVMSDVIVDKRINGMPLCDDHWHVVSYRKDWGG